jgi:gas vesicle structural protein
LGLKNNHNTLIKTKNHFVKIKPKKEKKMAKIQKATDSSSLAEVVDRILDKGIVIDAFVKVSLVGIELLAIEARIVIASVETYLKYAEAVGLTATEISA